MKTVIITCAALFCAVETFAQSFTPTPGFSAQEVLSVEGSSFSTGLGAFAADATHLYFLETNDFGGGTETHLRRSAISGGAIEDLVDFDATLGAGFLKINAGVAYFATTVDFTAYSIQSFGIAGSTLSTIGSVDYIYDLAFAGGAAFVSHSLGGYGTANYVSQLNLSNASVDSILNSGTDASGPLAFDADGNLYYGSTSFGGDGKIRKFSALQVASAIGGGPDLTLASGVELHSPVSNQYFELSMSLGLVQSYSPFGSSPLITAYELDGSGSSLVGLGGSSDFVSGLSWNGSNLFVGIRGVGNNDVKVFQISPVPEPSVAFLMLAGASLLVVRRRLR